MEFGNLTKLYAYEFAGALHVILQITQEEKMLKPSYVIMFSVQVS